MRQIPAECRVAPTIPPTAVPAMEWRMAYTSYTRCTSQVTFDDGTTLDVCAIPERLHTLSRGAFRTEWAALFLAGVHLKAERYDAEREFRQLRELCGASALHRAFLAYHMEHSLYDWAYLACAACGGPAAAVCSRCGRERYCGRACQVAAWRKHRRVCDPRSAAGPRPHTS
jgi:hypothetical protein